METLTRRRDGGKRAQKNRRTVGCGRRFEKVCSAPAPTVGQGAQRVNPPRAAPSILSSRANARDLLPASDACRSGRSQRNRRFSPEQPHRHTPIPNPPPRGCIQAAQPPLKKGAVDRAAIGGGICSSPAHAGSFRAWPSLLPSVQGNAGPSSCPRIQTPTRHHPNNPHTPQTLSATHPQKTPTHRKRPATHRRSLPTPARVALLSRRRCGRTRDAPPPSNATHRPRAQA